MAPLTVIQYNPNMINNSTTKLPAKPWWTGPGKEATEMQQVSGPYTNIGGREELAREGNDTDQLVPGSKPDVYEAQGTCLNLPFVPIILTGGRRGHGKSGF